MGRLSIHDEFLAAYDAFADAIFRHCYMRVSDRDRAKDFMQETFTRAWQYIAEGGRVGNIRAFLYRVANNLIIDESRKKKATSLDALQEEGFEPAAAEDDGAVEMKMDTERILAFVERVASPYREALLMRYVDGFSVKEIADIVGETANTVSVRIHRGVKMLKHLVPFHG